ncbi:MAG: hypothetical protein IPJ59_35090 [Nannocystis sp.]|nr:hypothetical protein [Nannocystis sp.]
MLATGANDGKLRIWNLADATIVGEFDLAASLEDVGRVEFPCPWAFRGTTDQVLLTAAGVVVLVNARTGTCWHRAPNCSRRDRVISTSDGSRAAHLTTGAIEFLGITADGRFDPGVSKVVRDPDFSSIMPAEFSPDGRSLAVATGAALRLSDAAGGAPRLASGADFATVKAMSFASDSTWIAVAGNDGVVPHHRRRRWPGRGDARPTDGAPLQQDCDRGDARVRYHGRRGLFPRGGPLRNGRPVDRHHRPRPRPPRVRTGVAIADSAIRGDRHHNEHADGARVDTGRRLRFRHTRRYALGRHTADPPPPRRIAWIGVASTVCPRPFSVSARRRSGCRVAMTAGLRLKSQGQAPRIAPMSVNVTT